MRGADERRSSRSLPPASWTRERAQTFARSRSSRLEPSPVSHRPLSQRAPAAARRAGGRRRQPPASVAIPLPGDAWCIVPRVAPGAPINRSRPAQLVRCARGAHSGSDSLGFLPDSARSRRPTNSHADDLHATDHRALLVAASARYDVFSRLLMDRIIFLGTEIDDDVANLIIAQLLFLEADGPGKDIQMYINSPGGSVSAGLAIYDTMRYLESPVGTTCMGMAASMGCFLLAAGHPGKRRSLPHARIMMHQPSQAGAVQGVAADIEICAKEIVYMRGKMFELLARHTGQPLERIERDFDRDGTCRRPRRGTTD